MRSGGGVLLISALELVSVSFATTHRLQALTCTLTTLPDRSCTLSAGSAAASRANIRTRDAQIVGVVLLGVFEGFKSHYFAGAHSRNSIVVVLLRQRVLAMHLAVMVASSVVLVDAFDHRQPACRHIQRGKEDSGQKCTR